MRILLWLHALWRTLVRSRAADADLDAELAAAVAELAARYRRDGLPPADAERRARLALGGVQQVKEATRDVRAGARLESLANDVRYALRSLAAAPAFSLAVIATVALAIGANTAIFSAVRQVLVEPLPYRDADRLVFIWSDLRAAGYPRAPLAGPELKDLRDRASHFEGLGAIWSNTAALTGGDDPEQLRIGLVTTNFFSVLGVDPAHGRHFDAADEDPGAPPSIVLSWDLWQRRFGGDARVVGTTIEVDGAPTLVAGVMPASLRLWMPLDANVPEDLQAWRPFARTILTNPRGQQFLRVVGRLRAGVTVADAHAQVQGIGEALGREIASYGLNPPSFSAVGLHADGVREVRRPIVALYVGVTLLLVLACINVANLFIARASARRADGVLRLALGASRGRLLQQCLAESSCLALAGAAAGVLLASGILRGLVSLRPHGLTRVNAEIDGAVLAFTLAVSLLWALLVSLAPFWTVVRRESPGEIVHGAGTRVAGSTSEYRVRSGLVILQIATSVTLVVAAGLLARSYTAVQRTDLGFRTAPALTFRMALPRARYRTPQEVNAFQMAAQDALSALPVVSAAAAVSHLPYDNGIPNWSTPYGRLDWPADTPLRDADSRTITPGYLATIGATLVEGRDFTWADQRGSEVVAIVDSLLADLMWPGESAIGKQLRADPFLSGGAATTVKVVGVVRHQRHRTPVADVREQIYFPQRQVLRSPIAFVVRTGDPGNAAVAVKEAIAALDPRLPIYDVRPLAHYLDQAISVQRFTALLATVFSAAAVALAAVGIYGVLAYSVVQRRYEIAIRLAVGAAQSRILRMVLGEAARLGGIGLVLGGGAALAIARLLETQLYQVSPYDPLAYAAGLALLAGCVLAAAMGPAWRATGVRATDSLRVQ